jgi:hypothetical protein
MRNSSRWWEWGSRKPSRRLPGSSRSEWSSKRLSRSWRGPAVGSKEPEGPSSEEAEDGVDQPQVTYKLV